MSPTPLGGQAEFSAPSLSVGVILAEYISEPVDTRQRCML